MESDRNNKSFLNRVWHEKLRGDFKLIVLIFVFALALRLILITQKNLWFDEIYSWHLSQQPFLSIIFTTWSDIHPPLFYFLLKIWIWIFGQSVISLRILPVLCSSISIFFIYPVARKILSEQNSLIVLILFALSPLNLFYSQEVRMAAVNLLFNLASVYYFINLVDSRDSTKGGRLYTIFTILALYTHYFSLFILLTQIIYLIYLKRSRHVNIRLFLKPYLIVFLVYLVWIPVMVIQISRGQPWRYEQNIGDVFFQLKAFTIDLALGFYQRYSDGILLYNLFLVLISIILLAALGCYWNYLTNKLNKRNVNPVNNSATSEMAGLQPMESSDSWRGIFIFLLFIIPLILAVLVSFKQWIEFFRYLSIIIPFFLILLVYGFTAFKSILRIILIGIFILINFYGLYLYFENDSKNNDYRKVMEYVCNTNANDKIFVYPFYYGWILDYFKEIGEYPKINHQDYGWEFHGIIDSVKSQNIDRFWFILDYHSFDTSSYKEKLNLLMQNEALKLEHTFFIQPQKVELYSLNKR